LPPQTTPFGIASLALALLGGIAVAFGGAGAIVGLVLGLLAVAVGGIAIRDISLGGSSARGTGLAVLGMLIGGLVLLLSAYKFAATGCAPMKTFKGMYEDAGSSEK